MSPSTRSRQLLGVVAAATAGALVVGAHVLASWAAPPPTPLDPAYADFRPAGDGSLPAERPALRAPDAPLSSDERGYAVRLALGALPTGARDVLGNPGGEVLAADLPLDTDRTGRPVSVALYDYATDRLHQVVVDLATDAVRAHTEAGGVQLPPSAAEAAVATQAAMTAVPPPAFVEEYRRLTGARLAAAEQLQVVAGVWRGDAATTACGEHRCLQLLLGLPSGQFLATQDFAVDLSTGQVLRTQEARPHEH